MESTINTKEVRKQIRRYAKQCIENLPLENPGPRDCWYCCMQTEEGKTLGDAVNDIEHLQSHIEEGYIVPSLVFRALQENHAGPWLFHIVFVDHSINNFDSIIERAIYNYMRRRLAPINRTEV
jgi:hypothetical protein